MAATAVWFGIMAHRAGKNRVVWAIGGGVLGLVVTTLVLGLGQATFLPFCTEEILKFRLMMTGIAVLLVSGLGWLFTGSLHQQIRDLGKSREQAATPATPEAPANPPAANRKP